MFHGLVSTASRWFDDLHRSLFGARLPSGTAPDANGGLPYQRLRKVWLTDEVSRTLFHEYAAHRASARGEEEIGWVLLGVRDTDQAVVLATLPAGAQRSAGV